MLKGKKILVTGGAGFIGSNLCEYFIQHNEVVCLDNLLTGKEENIEYLKKNKNFKFIQGDIRDLDTCLAAVNGCEIVFHQAALGSVPRSIESPLRTNDHNINGFLNMLEAAKQSNVKRFVFAASSSTYGDHKALPKEEANIGNPLSPYAVTKYVNELYAKVYSDLYGIETIGLRYFNVFGRRQDPHGAYAAVIPKFINLILSNKQIQINGDGEQTRDFTYIDNVIQANEKAALTNDKNALNTVYNVAFGATISLNNLVQVMEDLLNELGQAKNVDVSFGDNRLGDVRHSYASIDKANKYLSYIPEYDLRRGMKEYLSYYLDQVN